MQPTPINATNSSLSTSEMHLEPIVNFQRDFNAVVKTHSVSEILKFLEDFISVRPLSLGLLKQVYHHFKKTSGLEGLAREVASLIAAATVKQSSIGQNEFGLPPILESLNLFETPEHMVAQARSTKILFEAGIFYKKPLVCIGESMSKHVLAFKPYLDEFLEFITDPNGMELLESYENLAPFSTEYFYLSRNVSGHFLDFFLKLKEEIDIENMQINCFNLKSSTQIIASKYLKDYHFKEDNSYLVTCINKPSPNNEHHAGVYSESFDWLLKTDLKIFNLGDAFIEGKSNVINLNEKERPFEVDIFLAAKAKFYFGPKSVTSELASSFGNPSCIVLGTEVDSADPYAFVDLKQIYCKQSHQPLSKEQMSAFNVSSSTSSDVLSKFDLEFKKPVSSEVLKTIQAMVDRVLS